MSERLTITEETLAMFTTTTTAPDRRTPTLAPPILDMAYVRFPLRVAFAHIGEGINGDYDPRDPDDARLLRFEVLRWDDRSHTWGTVEYASYCTLLPVETPRELLVIGLTAIMNAVYGRLVGPKRESIRGLCEGYASMERLRGGLTWVDGRTKDGRTRAA